MRKKVSLLLALLTAAVCCLCIPSALANRSGEFTYEVLADGTAAVTDYSGKAQEVVIPASLDGYPVSTVSGDAFLRMSSSSIKKVSFPDTITYMDDNPFLGPVTSRLEQIVVSADHPYLATIDNVLFSKPDKRLICYPAGLTAPTYDVPDGVLEIAEDAFFGCKLRGVTLPETLTAIGGQAFDSSPLEYIRIPNSVSTIGRNPFRTCPNLGQVTVDPDHPYLATIDGVLFSKADKRLVSYPYTAARESYTVPQGLLEIGEMAFFRNAALREVIIPEGVTSIGNFCFYSCESLTSVTIPESVTEIGPRAFEECKNVTVTVKKGSYAEQFCMANGIQCAYPDANDWLHN